MKQRNNATVGTTNVCIFFSTTRYSLSTAYTCLPSEMNRGTVYTSQTDYARERSVWSQRVGTLVLGLKAQLKKMFVVFLFLLFVLCIRSATGVFEHGEVRVGLSTHNQTPPEKNHMWKNVSLFNQTLQEGDTTWNTSSCFSFGLTGISRKTSFCDGHYVDRFC